MELHSKQIIAADRHREGLVLCRSIKENQTLAAVPLFERRGFIEGRRERSVGRGLVEKLNIRPSRIDQTIINLSGGNQQKVMLSRGLTRDIKVFIFDEASCGIDVGAKREVYLLIKEQAAFSGGLVFCQPRCASLAVTRPLNPARLGAGWLVDELLSWEEPFGLLREGLGCCDR